MNSPEQFKPELFKKTKTTGILVPMAVSAGLILLAVSVVIGMNLRTDPKVHVLFESIMVLMLVFVVGTSFASLRREQGNYMLGVSLAFLGTLVLESLHALFSAATYLPTFGITLDTTFYGYDFWLAPRMYLAVALLLTLGNSHIERLLNRLHISVAGVYSCAAIALLVICTGVASWASHAWNGTSEYGIAQPAELLAGVIYLLALLGYILARRWQHSSFEVYLICGLLTCAILHLFVMPFSVQEYDGSYATAHFLKFASYGIFLAGVIVRSRDSTRAKLLEERLHSKSILEIVTDGIFTLDSKGNIKNINGAGCRILGETRDQMLGRDIKTWIPNIPLHQDELNVVNQSPVLNTPLELHGTRIDGTAVPLEITFNLVQQGRNERIYVGVMRDISDREKREMELRSLAMKLETALDAAGLGSWEWNPATNTSSWDAQANRLLGISSEDVKHNLSQQEVIACVHPEDRDVLETLFASDDLETKFRDKEYRIRRQDDGSTRWISSSGAMLFDENRELLGIVGVNRDITDYKTNIAALTAAREKAREASRVKSAFLANMSHEIRTPMNGVIGMLDVLQQSSLNVRQMEMTKLIKESSLSLLTLIDDILDFSKIEAGKLEIVEEPMSLEALIESVGASLDFLAREHGVEFAIFCDPDIPYSVMADAHRLRQVLINLSNNAIKFSSQEENTGRVTLRAQLVELTASAATIEFHVQDNGIGMDEETQKAVFESFRQADTTTHKRFGGTGLGLAITQSLVHMMDGEIHLESQPGEGSDFGVRLTFCLAQDNANNARADNCLSGLSCLLIKDAHGHSDDLARYLQSAGADVTLADRIGNARNWIGWAQASDALCIIDRGTQPCCADDIELMSRSDTQILLVGRGRQDHILAFETGARVDGNALGRRKLLGAVAVACGRMEAPPEDVPETDNCKKAAPSREDAIANDQLILVAEDNSINQAVILAQLSELGYAADIVGNGAEALDRWRKGSYSLVLTDLEMPELDGYGLATQIRAEEDGGDRHTPIIALSASALLGEAERCEAVGMDGFLPKPARLKDLGRMVKKWLRKAPAAPARDGSANLPDIKSVAKPVDITILKKLVGGNMALTESLLEDFRGSIGTLRDELLDAWRSGRLDQVGALAHKMKSSANTIGALTLGELCQEVEYAGKAYQAEPLADLVPRLEAQIIIVDEFIGSPAA